MDLKPEKALDSTPEFVRNKLRELGPMGRAEAITAVKSPLPLCFGDGPWHHLPSFFIGMVDWLGCPLAGITNADIGPEYRGPSALHGRNLQPSNVLTEYKITDWLAGYFVPIAQRLTFNAIVLLLVVAVAMFVVRFLDPSGFIAIAVLFIPIVDTTSAAGIPPLVLTAALILASVPFWASYQNIWVAMGEGITEGMAFSAAERVKLANVYAVLTLLTVAVSTGYWKLIGAL